MGDNRTPQVLRRVKRRVRTTRLAAGLLLVAGILVGTRFVRVDYADWATRLSVVQGPSSPALKAAERFVESRTGWLAKPEPHTWQALWDTVVPEKRGTKAGEWPWGPPVDPVLLAAAPYPRNGFPYAITQMRFSVVVGAPSYYSLIERVTLCHVEVSYVVEVNPGTAEATSYTASEGLLLRFVDTERRWLVDAGP